VCANHRRGDERRARLLERAAVAASVSRPSSDRSLAPHLDGSSAALARALDQLSDGDREVLALIAWEGLSARDAARVLGCTLPAVTMRLHRARRRLSELLRTEIEDD
jgi:RNA polymerase sigma-70 factor (ECF subfamily)